MQKQFSTCTSKRKFGMKKIDTVDFVNNIAKTVRSFSVNFLVQFLFSILVIGKVHNIEVKYNSLKTTKRAGELYAKNLMKNKRSLKRILPDFIIGAHSEQHSDALITWNRSDYDINKAVMTPVEVMEEHDKAPIL